MASPSQRAGNDRLVIGVAGRIGAGKTSAAKHISANYDFHYLRYSEVLASWFAADPKSRVDLQTFGWEVMEKGLQSELNRRLIDEIRLDSSAVVDGLRHPLDYASLDKAFRPSFYLIFLDATLEKRWEHARPGERYPNFEMFRAADSHPVEQKIDLLRTHASLILENDGTLMQLFGNMDSAVETLRKEGKR
jgi:dephospho-CoA kinase